MNKVVLSECAVAAAVLVQQGYFRVNAMGSIGYTDGGKDGLLITAQKQIAQLTVIQVRVGDKDGIG